jgi:hypothetical protein
MPPKISTPPPPTHSLLLTEAIALLHRKVGAHFVDPIVERQPPARVRCIEATLDREREMRLYGGQR